MSTMDKAVSNAKDRIRLLHKMLGNTTDPTEQIIARFCCETGVSEYTARRYMQMLIKAKLVVMEVEPKT